MKENKTSFFLLGLAISTLIFVLVWYWQKSTSADSGALTLLDRLAEAEARIRQLQTERFTTAPGRKQVGDEHRQGTATSSPTTASISASTASVDDLTAVRGVGPVFANRLQVAHIHTIEALAATPATTLAEILQIGIGRAEDIVAEAKSLL